MCRAEVRKAWALGANFIIILGAPQNKKFLKCSSFL